MERGLRDEKEGVGIRILNLASEKPQNRQVGCVNKNLKLSSSISRSVI